MTGNEFGCGLEITLNAGRAFEVAETGLRAGAAPGRLS